MTNTTESAGKLRGSLRDAALADDLDRMRHLLKDPNTSDVLQKHRFFAANLGTTVSHIEYAVRTGLVEQVRALLQAGASVMTCTNNAGLTPIHWAAESGDVDIVQLLIEAGSSVTGPSNAGWTPLLIAASRGRTEAALCLITYGADPHCKKCGGVSAVEIARRLGFDECADEMERHAQYHKQASSSYGAFSFVVFFSL
jgi:ankyrin repeat protein